MWLYFTILVATLGFWFVFYKLVNKPKKDMSVNDDIMTSDEDSVKDDPLYNSLNKCSMKAASSGNKNPDLKRPNNNNKTAAPRVYIGWDPELTQNLPSASTVYNNPIYNVPPVVNNFQDVTNYRSSTPCVNQPPPIPPKNEAEHAIKVNKAILNEIEREINSGNITKPKTKLYKLEEMQLTDSDSIHKQKTLVNLINIKIKEEKTTKYLQNSDGIYKAQVYHSNTAENNEPQFDSTTKSEHLKSKLNNEKSPSVNLSTTSSVDNTITPNNAEESVKDEQTQSQDKQETTKIDKGPINPPDSKMKNTEPDSKKSELEKYKFGTDKNTNLPDSPSTDNEIPPTTMEKTENIVDQDNKLKEDTLLATLLSIEEEVQTEYAPKIETFEGEYGNEQFYYLDEGLLTHLESLDRLQLKEYPDLRNRRKELFRYINGLLADLDKKAVKND